MKKYLFLLVLSLNTLLISHISAQEQKPFNVEISNDEYKIYIKMNLYDKDIIAPDNEALGKVDGYFGSTQSTNKWLITSSKIVNKKTAEIEVINDYGSEDFTAVIKLNDDGTYSYQKKNGSTLKFAVNSKWQKIPGNLTFTKKEQ
ncbi:MAG: hypothetical protein LUD48_00445 [Prevotella sp.]|nr:hypothetical protein [Prevotella sp.]